jgi:hypothetical protein
MRQPPRDNRAGTYRHPGRSDFAGIHQNDYRNHRDEMTR